MAETKDKLVDLEDLKVLADDTTTKLGGKLAVPLNEGTQGQVLTAKGDGTSEWADAKGGPLDIKSDVLTKNNIPVDQLIIADGVSARHSAVDISVFDIDTHQGELHKRSEVSLSADEAFISSFAGQGGFDGRTLHKVTGLALRMPKAQAGWCERVVAMLSSDAGDDLGYHNSPALMVFDYNIDTKWPDLLGYLEPSPDILIPGLCKGDETTVSMQSGTGTLSVKDGGITMAKLAQDVKDAIAGNAPTVNEADVRRIVNEQLAKMKFTINDQGHLIIETPEA